MKHRAGTNREANFTTDHRGAVPGQEDSRARLGGREADFAVRNGEATMESSTRSGGTARTNGYLTSDDSTGVLCQASAAGGVERQGALVAAEGWEK